LTKIHLNLLFSQHICEDNMTIIPLREQRLLVDLVEQIQLDITQGRDVPGGNLLAAIEQSTELRLDDRLRNVIGKVSIHAAKRRGRPRNSRGVEDFTMERVDARYRDLFCEFGRVAANSNPEQKESSASPQDGPASELAYRKLAHDMARELGNLDWRSLANKHSNWRNRFHSTDGDVDSEDYDAEIERQFPAP
jgi:hypothetical protein